MASDKNKSIPRSKTADPNAANSSTMNPPFTAGETTDGTATAPGQEATTTNTETHEHQQATDAASATIPTSKTDDTQELYIKLNYSLLLALALHKSRPVVYINEAVQMQLLDAFLNGDINNQGVVTRMAPARDAEGKRLYTLLCSRLVPNLMMRLKAQRNKNFREEPKNRIRGSTKPGHGELSAHMIITPDILKMYRRLLESPKLAVHDIERPDECPLLFEFLNGIVEEQYDFEKWIHVSPDPVFKQKPLVKGEGKREEFQTDSSKPGKILAVVQVKIPGTEKYFSQLDLIPERRDDPQNADSDAKKARGEKKGQIYFEPDPNEVIIPKKPRNKELRWVAKDKHKKEWVRSDGATWKCKILVREFDHETDAYLKPRMITLDWLRDIDPNNKEWKDRYNMYFRQLVRRGTQQVTVVRQHWSAAEIVVIYDAINAWCQKHGVDAFEDNIFTATDLSAITAEVNKVHNRNRNNASIRSWISHKIRNLKSPVGTLALQAIEMKKRIDNGKTVPNNERYPYEAIPIPEVTGEQRVRGEDDDSEDEESDQEDTTASPSKRNRIVEDVPAAEDLRNYNLDADFDGDLDLIGRDQDSPPASPTKKQG